MARMSAGSDSDNPAHNGRPALLTLPAPLPSPPRPSLWQRLLRFFRPKRTCHHCGASDWVHWHGRQGKKGGLICRRCWRSQ